MPLMIIKKDDSREAYDRAKIERGIVSSCHKRPISSAQITAMTDAVETALFNREEREIPSTVIGEMVMEQLKQIKGFIHSIWTDLRESTTQPINKILMTVVLWGIVTSLSVYGYVHLNQKASYLQEQQETFVIQMNAESDYIVSKEAKLLETFRENKNSQTSHTSIFDSLQGEPLMIVSTDEHEGILELTLLGSTERLINWINTVDEKEPSRHIEIEDIERKGNVVYVHCAVKSRI